MDKKTGIWIDKKKAFIIDLIDKQVETRIIESSIEDFHPKGGARSKTIYGPAAPIKEKSYLEREKKQTIDFFKRILRFTADSSGLYLFGPAQMKNKLGKFIRDATGAHPIILKIDAEDSITKNQMVAKVKAFFTENPGVKHATNVKMN